MLRAARWLAFGSAATSLLSIAICEILLALAVAALLLSGARLRWPRIWPPLALFVLATLISLALSDDPAAGLKQVRKFYVLLELMVVFSALRDIVLVRRLFLTIAGVATASAVLGCFQFARKVHEAQALGRDFYAFYMPERITGFMSHWMTYSGELMIAIVLLAALVLFAPASRRHIALWLACAAVIGVGLVLGYTRSVSFIAAPGAALYLVWIWRPKVLLLLPVLLLGAFAVAPGSMRARFTSMFRPKKDIDSNQFRIVAWRTGWEMVRKHPLFGLGPEEVNLEFQQYVPSDIPRPLPSGWYGHLHNIYIHYAAERGVPAALVLVWLLVAMLVDFVRGARRAPPGRSDVKCILHAAAAVVIAIMIEGVFELNLGDSEVLILFLAVVGCGYAALECVRAPRAEAAHE